MESWTICYWCHMSGLESYYKENSDKEDNEEYQFSLYLLSTKICIKPWKTKNE